MLPPILLTALWALLRPWPRWMQDLIFDVQTGYHQDMTPCRNRWCEDRHW